MTNPYTPIAPGAFTPAFSGTPPTIGSAAPGGAAAFQQPIPNYDELFASLPELRWKDISLPYVSLRTDLRQDLVIHKFVDKNGAHIEGTGRAPLQVVGRLPMLNGLRAGKNELWQRPLYPFTWGNLVRACADKTTGTLQHPELGPLTCKCEILSWVLDAHTRQGVWMDITWLETDDGGASLDDNLASPSPLANAAAAAADLDGLVSTPNPVWPDQPEFEPDFTDFMNSIRAVFDTTTLLQYQFAGRINSMFFQCGQLEDSITRADNALNWPMTDAAERAKSACNDLKQTLLTRNRAIGLYTVAVDSTLSEVANDIGAPPLDIVQLNPQFAGQTLIIKNSIIRYYKAA